MKKRLFVLTFLVMSLGVRLYAEVEDPRPDRFSFEVNNMIQWDKKNSYATNAVLFLGSSSIRMWETGEAFPGITLQNRGFGGAHISDVNFYFEELAVHLKPRLIVFYCGDNDIDAGKDMKQVLKDYVEFTALVRKKLPRCRIIYLPIKPSVARWSKWPEMDKLNQAIKKFTEKDPLQDYVDTATIILDLDSTPRAELFKKDGLHLNEQGYALWNKILEPWLK